MSIRIGTASWSHPALIDSGRFYPRESMSAEDRLRFYASRFPMVELDSSYYAISTPGQAHRWVARTPDGFEMNVKALGLFTGHAAAPEALGSELRGELPARLRHKAVLYYRDLPPAFRDVLWQRFVDGVAPLRHAGRLGLVHLQFAPWVMRNGAGQAHVEHCVERLQGHTASVEFRHMSWFEGSHAKDTLEFLRRLGAVHTVVDGPQGFRNSVPVLWETTHEARALVRLHGRNAQSWNTRDGSSSGRFNYDYDDAELEGLARQMAALDRPTLRLQVVLNNNAEDRAQANGQRLVETLAAFGADVVLPSQSQESPGERVARAGV